MIVGGILKQVQAVVQTGLGTLGATISRLTKPIADATPAGTTADLVRSKPQLIAENMVLRQQLIVLKPLCQGGNFTSGDRSLCSLRQSAAHLEKHLADRQTGDGAAVAS